MATFEDTQVAVYLSLNVEVLNDRRGIDCFALPIVSVAWLVLWLWPKVYQVRNWWTRAKRRWRLTVNAVRFFGQPVLAFG